MIQRGYPFFIPETRTQNGANADISQPMIGGEKKDQYESVTPTDCSTNGKV